MLHQSPKSYALLAELKINLNIGLREREKRGETTNNADWRRDVATDNFKEPTKDKRR
jgi:hypothetical protein